MPTRVNDKDHIPQHLQDRYLAFGILEDDLQCITPAAHPTKHEWGCFLCGPSAIDLLSYILDGALTHWIDGSRRFDKGRLVYRWKYCVDWDKRVVRVPGPMPGKMVVAFEKMDAQWMAGCRSANEAFG